MEQDTKSSARTPTLLNPVARLLELAATPGRRHIIGLSGVPGSGKTTLCAQWERAVKAAAGPEAIAVLGMDGFHLSRAALRALPDPEHAFARRGAPWTFNPSAIAGQLSALHEGFSRNTVEWPGFEHSVGDPVQGAFHVCPDVRVVVVEGIYTACSEPGWESVLERFDEQWYLDVSWEQASPRLIARHVSAWGMSSEAATRRADSNDRLNAEVVQQGRVHAHWLIRPEIAHPGTPRI